VRLGLLSTARINRALLDVRGASDAFQIVAVGSRAGARGQAYAREWQIPRPHASYDELLADPEVDAVYIALPNALHHHWTMRALAAGKHVLCEKPYSRDPEDVEEAFDAARQAGLVLMEGYMWRHSPQTAKLVELLPELGELQAIRASFGFRLTDRANVRLEAGLGGGALLDVGCYCVSGARLLAGAEPERVYAEARMRAGIDVALTALLRFPDGVVAELACSFTAAHESLEAVGSEGTLLVPSPWHAQTGIVLLRGEEVRVPFVSPYLAELENFAAAVRGTAEPLLGRDDALGQARTLDALLRSAASGRPVEL
jgi:xylose dehydrogenase (NAD/NADP)